MRVAAMFGCLIVVGACDGGAAKPKARDAAVKRVAPPDATAAPSFVTLRPGDRATLGDVTLELVVSEGFWFTPAGVQIQFASLIARRGTDEQGFGMRGRYGSSWLPMEAELEFLEDVLVVEDTGDGLKVTLLDPAPDRIPDHTALMRIVEAREQAGLPADSTHLPGTEDPDVMPGIFEMRGDTWGGRFGSFTGHLELFDAPPREVIPPRMPDSMPLVRDKTKPLPHGVTAALAAETLTLRKAGQEVTFELEGDDANAMNAELIAFGHVYVTQDDVDDVWIAEGAAKVPRPIERARAIAAIEQAAADGGWPLEPWRAVVDVVTPTEVDGYQTFRAGDAWVARVGSYTGRVWITER